MLDILFSLNCVLSSVVALVINQHFDSIPLGEARYEPFPMLENPADQISGNADIERPAATTGKDIDPEAHFSMMICFNRGSNDQSEWRRIYLSPAGLTRGSIFFAKSFFAKMMDCRVKPGNDR